MVGWLLSRSALHWLNMVSDDNPDDAERRKEFVEEFESLTSANQLLLSNFLAESDPGSVLSLRTAPSNCVADVHLVLDTLKSLVRSNHRFYRCFLNPNLDLVVEVSMWRRRFLLLHQEHQGV